MGRIFVTSDTHFGHDREFIYGPRNFTSVKESDEEIIRRWNEVVQPEDTVYHLGDVMLNDNENGLRCLSQLNGTIKLIRGNHDTDRRWKLYQTLSNVEVIGWADVIKYKKHTFYLSHHPCLTSNLDDMSPLGMRVLNLFGHTHQTTKFYEGRPYMYHVGLDSHNCYPVLLDDVLEAMKAEVRGCLAQLEDN